MEGTEMLAWASVSLSMVSQKDKEKEVWGVRGDDMVFISIKRGNTASTKSYSQRYIF